jgi:hypothetical protein
LAVLARQGWVKPVAEFAEGFLKYLEPKTIGLPGE